MKQYQPITHVAICFRDKIYSLPKPNRHHDVIALIVKKTGVNTVDGEERDQGFLDASGRYLTRKQALFIAERCGQLLSDRTIYLNQLFSENLW